MALKIMLLKNNVPQKHSTQGESQLYAQLTRGSFTERIILNVEYWSWEELRRKLREERARSNISKRKHNT